MQFGFAHDPLFANPFLANFKLRLDQRNQIAARLDPLHTGRKHGTKPDKAGIANNDINVIRDLFFGQMPRIGLFHDHNAVIITQLPIKLPLPDIDGINLGRPVLKQNIGKAAGGCTDIDRDKIGHVDLELGQPFFKLEPAA